MKKVTEQNVNIDMIHYKQGDIIFFNSVYLKLTINILYLIVFFLMPTGDSTTIFLRSSITAFLEDFLAFSRCKLVLVTRKTLVNQ